MSRRETRLSSEVDQILSGTPLVVEETTTMRAVRDNIHQEVLNCTELLVGKQCRSALATEGLEYLHRHFPRSELPPLVALLSYRTGHQVISLLSNLCRERFGLQEFNVEAFLAYRFHYPHGEQGPDIGPKRALRSSIARYWLDALYAYHRHKRGRFRRSVGMLASKVARGYQRPALTNPYVDGHAPHRDYWFGYALDSLNLWWAISDVHSKNGMVLFPGCQSMDLKHEEKGPPYVARNEMTPEGVRYTPLHAGQLLIFSTNDLHGTRLNVTDRTRVVISLRVTPGKVRYCEQSKNRFRGKFHLSSSIERRDFRTICEGGEPGQPRAAGRLTSLQPPAEVTIPQRFSSRSGHLFPASLFENNNRVLVHYNDMHVLVCKHADGVRAIDAICPHQGYCLAYGRVKGERVVCPGHAIEFDIVTGQSDAGYTVGTYPCEIRSGHVYLKDLSADE